MAGNGYGMTMSNDSAVVDSSPPMAPIPPVVQQPVITTEQAESMLAEAAKARVIACERDVRAALAKHKCELDAFPVAECGADGITRHRAVVRIVPS